PCACLAVARRPAPAALARDRVAPRPLPLGRRAGVRRARARARRRMDGAALALVAELVAAGAVGRADARDDGLLRAFVQWLSPALHGCEELVEVDLERGEDPVGPVFHLEARLARLAAGLVDDVLRLVLGDLHDLRLRGLPHGLLTGLREQPVDLPLRLG